MFKRDDRGVHRGGVNSAVIVRSDNDVYRSAYVDYGFKSLLNVSGLVFQAGIVHAV